VVKIIHIQIKLHCQIFLFTFQDIKTDGVCVFRLSGCMVTERGCCFLASALSSNPSHLRELDLSYNHPGKSLINLLSDPNYRLEKLKYVQY